MHKFIVLLTALAWLSGCAVGRTINRWNRTRRALPGGAAGVGRQRREQRFWAGFDDPMLAGLIRQTLDANRDLRAALARYQRAEHLRGSRAEQLPNVGVSASAAEQHLADVERTPPGSDDRVELYQAAAGLSWELDLFGRLRRASEAQRAELGAAGPTWPRCRWRWWGNWPPATSNCAACSNNCWWRAATWTTSASLEIVRSRVGAGRGTAFDEVARYPVGSHPRGDPRSAGSGARACSASLCSPGRIRGAGGRAGAAGAAAGKHR